MLKILKNTIFFIFVCVSMATDNIHVCFVTMAYCLYDMSINYIKNIEQFFLENLRPKRPLIDSSPFRMINTNFKMFVNL